ncbi:MAG TPA: lipopolysaccharide heptosyltransferase I [Usitatibacter sp.]|nr:lipopolysaccharide heptosyltransferase I [Usitatibacter sp.]
MPAPRILLVKLSSLGDVIHLLPAVSDLRGRVPGAHVGWAVEEAYRPLVRLHPGVDDAIAVPLRALRREPFSPRRWRALAAARRALRAGAWDYVIDAQGLLKSACVARWARGPAFGLDARSARERIASRFYDVKVPVARDLHAVERNRRLLGQVFGYAVDAAPRYGLAPPSAPPAWVPARRYAVLLHAASRPAKLWPEARWIELARLFSAEGWATVFPGGTAAERDAAARLAATAGPDALAAPAMDLGEAAALLAHAGAVVGVDTGLTHLAVALDVPTVVGIYCATSPRLTGLHGGASAANLGGPAAAPEVREVAAAAGLGAGA